MPCRRKKSRPPLRHVVEAEALVRSTLRRRLGPVQLTSERSHDLSLVTDLSDRSGRAGRGAVRLFVVTASCENGDTDQHHHGLRGGKKTTLHFFTFPFDVTQKRDCTSRSHI
jgi:hypothetical protein